MYVINKSKCFVQCDEFLERLVVSHSCIPTSLGKKALMHVEKSISSSEEKIQDNLLGRGGC